MGYSRIKQSNRRFKMPEYTLLATCDRCGKQVSSNFKSGDNLIIDVVGLKYNDYVQQAGCNERGAYLCPECHKLAQNMRDRHYKERKEFCLAITS
jgi:hypothetical protein